MAPAFKTYYGNVPSTCTKIYSQELIRKIRFGLFEQEMGGMVLAQVVVFGESGASLLESPIKGSENKIKGFREVEFSEDEVIISAQVGVKFDAPLTVQFIVINWKATKELPTE